MGFVSYNEDVQKRWESDNHELLRKLELDTVSMLQQKHALPEFELLVAKLGEILADPSQPYAMHLMKMRTRERDLVEQNEKLSKKRTELSDKNSMLNEKIRLLEKDNSSRLI